MIAKKIALVTGGTRGIGAAICKTLKADGYHVIANYTGNKKAADVFTDETGIKTLKFDVSNFVAVQKACKNLEIDILVNNAGIFNMASLDKITPEDYRRQYDVNVGGTIFACQAVVPLMKERGGGAIINFASQAGRRGEPNIAIYCSNFAHAVIGVGTGGRQHPGQRHRAGRGGYAHVGHRGRAIRTVRKQAPRPKETRGRRGGSSRPHG